MVRKIRCHFCHDRLAFAFLIQPTQQKLCGLLVAEPEKNYSLHQSKFFIQSVLWLVFLFLNVCSWFLARAVSALARLVLP